MAEKNIDLPKHSKIRRVIIIVCILLFVDLVYTAIKSYVVVPYLLTYHELNMKQTSDVAENILAAKDNKQFAGIIKKLGYESLLHSAGPYTVFVPTDAAYKNLPEETKKYFTDPVNIGDSRALVQYHIVKGIYPFSSLKDGMTLETIVGEKLHITKKDDYVMINEYAYVQTYDVISKNGLIHIVTNYLIPPSILGEPEETQ